VLDHIAGARAQRRLVAHDARSFDAVARVLARRLDDRRQRQAVENPLAALEQDVARHRDAARREQRLRHRLLEAQRHRARRRARVRQVAELEQPRERRLLARVAADRLDQVDRT